MLIRIVDGNVVQHVCVQCAEEHDIPNENATWAKRGWCFLCGKVPGSKVDSPKRRLAAFQKFLGLIDTEAETETEER
jgi:hypothetical protein